MKILALIAVLASLMMPGRNKKAAEPEGMKTPTAVIRLYPEGQRVDKGIVENGVAITLGPCTDNGDFKGETTNERGNCRSTGDEARMMLYIPENCNGQMVVICPGGGYFNTSVRREGETVAEWLTTRGIAACVVVYRMPNHSHPIVPLTDVQNAMRYCRHHAGEWGVKQIGVMGFSAGGHLAASASTLFVDDITRPDFSVLIYPVISMEEGVTHGGTRNNLTDDGKDDALVQYYSLEKRVSAKTPATFLALSGDDQAVPAENSIRYFKACRANGVQAEMYIMPSGGHGWGFPPKGESDQRLSDGTRELFYHALDNFLERMRK